MLLSIFSARTYLQKPTVKLAHPKSYRSLSKLTADLKCLDLHGNTGYI